MAITRTVGDETVTLDRTIIEFAMADQRGPTPHAGRDAGHAEADVLRPFMGQWVAQRGLEVLVAAASPEAVVAWLQQHEQTGATILRVPRTEADTDTSAVQPDLGGARR